MRGWIFESFFLTIHVLAVWVSCVLRVLNDTQCYAASRRSWSIEFLMTLDNLSHLIHRITRWHREFRDSEVPVIRESYFAFCISIILGTSARNGRGGYYFLNWSWAGERGFPKRHRPLEMWTCCVQVKDKNRFRAMIISSSHVIGIIFRYIFKMLQVCHGLHYFSNNNFFCYFATALSFWCTYCDFQTIYLNWGYYERVISPRRNKLNGYYYYYS